MNNISLYHLTEQHQQLLSQLYNVETGEIDEKIEAQINALLPTIQDKCIAVAKWIKKLQIEQNEIEQLKKDLAVREAAYNKELEDTQDYLKRQMEKSGLSKISCPYFTLLIKKNRHSTDILNEFDIPAEFMRIKEPVMPPPKPDREAIKEYVLRTGEQVPGAYVSQKTKLVISLDKI